MRSLFTVQEPKRLGLPRVRMAEMFKHLLNIYPMSGGVKPILRVQGNARGTNWGGATSITVNLVQAPVQNNVLVATISLHDVGGPVPDVLSITQVGVVWSFVVAREGWFNQNRSEIWFGVVGAGAGTAITVNLTGAIDNAIANVCEYSGVRTVGYTDQTASNSADVLSLTSDTGTTPNTTQAQELWVGCTTGKSGNGLYQANPTNGFTMLDGGPYGAGGFTSAFLEKIVNAIGAANSGTSFYIGGVPQTSEWSGCIATFFGG